MDQSSSMQLDMTFEDDPVGVRVTGEVAAWDFTATQPMGGPVKGGLENLEGPLVFTLDGRGVVDVISVPEASGAAAQFARLHSMAHGIFPRLPNRTVVAGASWTDTLTWSAEESGADITSTTIYHYTATGDTVVDGRSLLVMAVESETEVHTEATQQGMEVTMALSSSERGVALWDLERAMLYASDMDRTMTGTFEVGGMGMPPMTMEASGPVRVRLANEMGSSQ